MSSLMAVRFEWDGELKPCAIMRVPIKLIPQVGDLMRMNPWEYRYADPARAQRAFEEAKRAGARDVEIEDDDIDGDWFHLPPFTAVILERRLDLQYEPAPSNMGRVEPYDDDPSIWVTLVVARHGEERPKK